MGFYSWVCPACEKSILSAYVKDVNPLWSSAILVTKAGPIAGTYNGYGCMAGQGLSKRKIIKLYHSACFIALGRPDYAKARVSLNAGDQGYFIELRDYKGMPYPTVWSEKGGAV